MVLPFPLWVIAGALGFALVALAFILRGSERRLSLAVGTPLLLLWLFSGIRARSFARASESRELRDRAARRDRDPPVAGPEDPAGLRRRRERSRAIRRGDRWFHRFPPFRRYDFPRAEDHDPP